MSPEAFFTVAVVALIAIATWNYRDKLQEVLQERKHVYRKEQRVGEWRRDEWKRIERIAKPTGPTEESGAHEVVYRHYRFISFNELYEKTILSEIFGIATHRLWLIFLAVMVGVPVGLASGGFEVGSVIFSIAICYGLLMLFPCRRILTSIGTLMVGVSIHSDEQTSDQLGAREPTRVERQKINDALSLIQGRAPIKHIAEPSEWLVMDSPIPNSFTVGTSSYLTTAAIESEYLPALMAHELGHLKSGDGVRLMALRALVYPLAFFLGLDRQVTPIGTIAGGRLIPVDSHGPDEKIVYRMQAWQLQLAATVELGGYGLLVNCVQWAAYWRQQDFTADAYAMSLGFGLELIQILERYQIFDIAQPFLMSGRPYTAERIDRLKG